MWIQNSKFYYFIKVYHLLVVNHLKKKVLPSARSIQRTLDNVGISHNLINVKVSNNNVIKCCCVSSCCSRTSRRLVDIDQDCEHKK